VLQAEAALPLERALKERTSGSWSRIRDLVTSGKVTVDGTTCFDDRRLVFPGQAIAIRMNAPRERPGAALTDALVRHHDRDLVVVSKPEGLSSMTHDGESQSVDRLVGQWLEKKLGRRRPAVHVVHRLDKVTSGIMVYALNREATLALKEQFRAHTVGRVYHAIAHGHVHSQRLEYRIVRDRGDGLRGITREANAGVRSVTNVEACEVLARCTAIHCRLETGRTHQIRIHLAHIGHALVGEPLYTKGKSGPWLQASRVMLHARTLAFEHPRTGARLSFEAQVPDAFEQFLRAERERG